MDIAIWIFLALLFVIIELITTTFFFIWFGAGSVVAAILNYFGFDTYVQISGFVIVSLILIFLTRRFADKIVPANDKKTTAEKLIGKQAKVLRQIDDNTFIVKVSGEEWTAHTNDSVNINETVNVVGINSIILIIEKINDGE